jgi:regulator of RNase E activity RraB
MKLKHIPTTIDINSRNEQRIAGIVNINDKKTRYLDVTIIASGEKLDISGCTVTAIFVIDDVLVNNAVDCTVTNNIVTIPLENFNGRYGYLSIELNIVKDGTVIVNTPIPLRIQVTSSIADSAKISEKTYGTIAETVKEVYDARGTYENLSNRLTGIDNEITDIDETVTMKINLKADKATTLAGYGIEDAYTKTYVSKALSYKLDKKPFDSEPKQDSPNYVTSGTVYGSISTLKSDVSKALNYKLDKKPFDSEPTQASPNYVTSGTVYGSISTLKSDVNKALATKYDSSNVESGTGSLTPGQAIYDGNEGSFNYVKNGKVVTVSVNITKLVADKSYIQMAGLPFPAKNESRLSSFAVYSTASNLKNIRLDGSWLYINSTDKFVEGEKINFIITYIIK